jgi:hypothetical protein
MVAEQVLHRYAIGRDRIVQAKLREILAHRLRPIQAAFVHQHAEARGGERFGDRAKGELRVDGDRQAGFDVALAVDPQQVRFAVAHHAKGKSGNLPFRHRFIDKGIKIAQSSAGHGCALLYNVSCSG